MARIGDGKWSATCPRHSKRTFETENEAKLQLLRAQLVHTDEGKAKIEKRYFACELGGFHLTSWDDKKGPIR